jgi:hypothetical protein
MNPDARTVSNNWEIYYEVKETEVVANDSFSLLTPNDQHIVRNGMQAAMRNWSFFYSTNQYTGEITTTFPLRHLGLDAETLTMLSSLAQNHASNATST